MTTIKSEKPTRTGQATVEYAIVAGILMASLAVLSLLVSTFREYSARVVENVASEYP